LLYGNVDGVEFITLDGVVEAPAASRVTRIPLIDYATELERYKADGSDRRRRCCSAQTYEQFAEATTVLAKLPTCSTTS
jgi:hypothetical protein